MIRTVVILGLIAGLVAGCASREARYAFDGQYYRSKAGSVEGDRRQFVVSVSPVSASLEGAADAGRHEATRYCIENYGSSEADWIVGPDQNPGSYRIEDDTLVLRGACAG